MLRWHGSLHYMASKHREIPKRKEQAHTWSSMHPNQEASGSHHLPLQFKFRLPLFSCPPFLWTECSFANALHLRNQRREEKLRPPELFALCHLCQCRVESSDGSPLWSLWAMGLPLHLTGAAFSSSTVVNCRGEGASSLVLTPLQPSEDQWKQGMGDYAGDSWTPLGKAEEKPSKVVVFS